MSSSHGNTANTNLASGAASNDSVLKRKSDDIGWEFGHLIDPTNFDRVECKLCGKKFGGGVYRLKQHVAHISGNVSKCLRSTKEDQEKCKKAIEDAKNKKKKKCREEQEIRAEVDIFGIEEEEEEIEGLGPRKKPNFLGPMDKFTSKIDAESSMSTSKALRQQNMNDALFKQRTHSVHQYVAR